METDLVIARIRLLDDVTVRNSMGRGRESTLRELQHGINILVVLFFEERSRAMSEVNTYLGTLA